MAQEFATLAENYAALESRGFSRAEAIRIVAAQRIPPISSSVAR